MLLARLLRCYDRSLSRCPGHVRRPSSQQQPRVESLEERTLLSGWAMDVGGTGNNDGGRFVATDAAGNVYVTGAFQGTVDFDPGPGTTNLVSNGVAGDIFVAKYSTAGALLWARRAGGNDATNYDSGRGIATDSAGNVYVVGHFYGTADFSSFNLTNAGGSHLFVAKLDSSGNFLWAESTGSTGFEWAFGISTDSSANVYVTGGFENTVDFDMGPGTYNLTSAGGRDAYALKLDTNGSFIWAQRAGG